MKKKNTTIYWVLGAVLVLGALFAYPLLQSGNGSAGLDVPCLLPNLPLLQHIHPVLKIEVDGKNEEIPAGIGLEGCERAIHTHKEDAARGVLHIESQDRREYKLADFFSVWGKTIEREGFSLEALLDGKPLSDPLNLILEDNQQILLKYAKK